MCVGTCMYTLSVTRNNHVTYWPNGLQLKLLSSFPAYCAEVSLGRNWTELRTNNINGSGNFVRHLQHTSCSFTSSSLWPDKEAPLLQITINARGEGLRYLWSIFRHDSEVIYLQSGYTVNYRAFVQEFRRAVSTTHVKRKRGILEARNHDINTNGQTWSR